MKLHRGTRAPATCGTWVLFQVSPPQRFALFSTLLDLLPFCSHLNFSSSFPWGHSPNKSHSQESLSQDLLSGDSKIRLCKTYYHYFTMKKLRHTHTHPHTDSFLPSFPPSPLPSPSPFFCFPLSVISYSSFS